MIHPDTELRFISETVGFGVVASRLIPRGTITWARDEIDQVFTPRRIATLSDFGRAAVDRYGYLNPNGDAIVCWDLARYVNHSCAPTCMSPGFDFEVAVRDIVPGAELTDDYSSLNIGHSFACHCGAPNCRGNATPEDFDRLAADWDQEVAAVFPLIATVPQALWELVKDKPEVEAILRGEKSPPSCRRNKVTPVP